MDPVYLKHSHQDSGEQARSWVPCDQAFLQGCIGMLEKPEAPSSGLEGLCARLAYFRNVYAVLSWGQGLDSSSRGSPLPPTPTIKSLSDTWSEDRRTAAISPSTCTSVPSKTENTQNSDCRHIFPN